MIVKNQRRQFEKNPEKRGQTIGFNFIDKKTKYAFGQKDGGSADPVRSGNYQIPTNSAEGPFPFLWQLHPLPQNLFEGTQTDTSLFKREINVVTCNAKVKPVN